MLSLSVSDRSITCPHCLSENVFVGSDLHPRSQVNCSRCGQRIGPWSDVKVRQAEVERGVKATTTIGQLKRA